MKVLITYFEPFGGRTVNSSERAVALLPHSFGGHEISTLCLPVSYARSVDLLLTEVRERCPGAILCVGQQEGISEVRIETTGGNYAHSEQEDNDHNLWLYRSIDMSGAPSYRSTLPAETIAKNIRDAGIAVEVSHSAGTYVCNCLLYSVLRAFERDKTEIPVGLIHVPCVPEQCEDPAKTPCMSAEEASRALLIAIGTTIDPACEDPLAVSAAERGQDTKETGQSASDTARTEVTADTETGMADAARTNAAENSGTGMPGAGMPGAARTNAAENAETGMADIARTNAAENAGTGMADVARTNAAENAGAGMADAARTNIAENAGTGAATASESGSADSAKRGAKQSATAAAAAYFTQIYRAEERKTLEEDSLYYSRSGRSNERTPRDEARENDVRRRISGRVPEKVEILNPEPRETLFEPAQERYRPDTSDYRVYSVKDKYRGSESDLTEKMTLTEYMETFVPERVKTPAELNEERRRMLIQPEENPDTRTPAERAELRRKAELAEKEKEHIFYGDFTMMSETVRAIGKTLNKSVMADGVIHNLLYTSIEDNGDIVGYRIRLLKSVDDNADRNLGEFPKYAMPYESYYLFTALTERKKIVCDPDTYEIHLEDA